MILKREVTHKFMHLPLHILSPFSLAQIPIQQKSILAW